MFARAFATEYDGCAECERCQSKQRYERSPSDVAASAQSWGVIRVVRISLAETKHGPPLSSSQQCYDDGRPEGNHEPKDHLYMSLISDTIYYDDRTSTP